VLPKLLDRLTYANVMATVAVFIALGGGAFAISIKKNSVGSKEIKNGRVKSVDVKDDSLTGKDVNESKLSLPKGPQGKQGLPGQDATKLFAYIRDGGSGSAATVVYGRGVTGIDDPAGSNGYTVTFDRSLADCVVDATAGVGNPSGTLPLAAGARIPFVNMSSPGAGDQVEVVFITEAGPVADTSFMITAFC
jgi:hypothetical protein